MTTFFIILMPNKKYMKYLFRLFFVTFISTNVFSQAASYTDPAQAYLRLMLEKGGTEVVRIGSFKVTGTPYLFGEKNQWKCVYSICQYSKCSGELQYIFSSNRDS